MMQKHYVHFESPGTFVAETNTKEVPSWDVDLAVAMSSDIQQRHGARPYGFYFTTRARGEEDFDSKQVARSGMYYLGGKVETREEVDARNDPSEDVLRFNMRANNVRRIWTSTNGYRWTRALEDGDTVIDQ